MTRQVGAVAGGHEHTARAGAEMLADGGNAVDAATAAVFCSCMCEPTLTSLGGAGFATVHIDGGPDLVFDFFAAVPGIGRTVDTATGPVPVEVLFGATTQTFHVGPQSCAVPGFVAGVLGMHERFGRLPRTRIIEPAAQLARRGLPISAEQAFCHRILERIVTRTAPGRRIYAPEGLMLGEGDHFAQPWLADTLELLARHGAETFYRGELAAGILRWSDDNGGLISADDLRSYRVHQHRPVHSGYRSLDFLSVPPPSSGGSLVAYALTLLDIARGGYVIDVDTAAGAEMLVNAMIAANAIRGAEFDRYLYGEGLVSWLMGDGAVERGLAVMLSGEAAQLSLPSSRLGATTQVSAIDAEGNAVAITTSTGCGSGEFVGGTGIHLNNMLGEEDLMPVEHKLVPGDRLTSMMAPSLLLASGKPLLATGSAGSNRIRSAILQTLLRVVESRFVDGDASLQQRAADAVATGRLHPEAGMVHVEPDCELYVLEHLRSCGHDLNLWPSHNLYFGGVNMVAVAEDGSFAPAADPRRGGGACIALADGSVVLP